MNWTRIDFSPNRSHGRYWHRRVVAGGSRGWATGNSDGTRVVNYERKKNAKWAHNHHIFNYFTHIYVGEHTRVMKKLSRVENCSAEVESSQYLFTLVAICRNNNEKALQRDYTIFSSPLSYQRSSELAESFVFALTTTTKALFVITFYGRFCEWSESGWLCCYFMK